MVRSTLSIPSFPVKWSTGGPCRFGRNKKSRRGRTLWNVRPRRLTRQRAPRRCRVALHLVVRPARFKSSSEPTANSDQPHIRLIVPRGEGIASEFSWDFLWEFRSDTSSFAVFRRQCVHPASSHLCAVQIPTERQSVSKSLVEIIHQMMVLSLDLLV
jgi:hypothetical protein